MIRYIFVTGGKAFKYVFTAPPPPPSQPKSRYSTYGYSAAVKADKNAQIPMSPPKEAPSLEYLEDDGCHHIYVIYNDYISDDDIMALGVLTSSPNRVYFKQYDIWVIPIEVSHVTFKNEEKTQYFVPFPEPQILPLYNAIHAINVTPFLEKKEIRDKLDAIEALKKFATILDAKKKWEKFSNIIDDNNDANNT